MAALTIIDGQRCSVKEGVSETDAYLPSFPLACTSDDDACRSIDQSRPCSAFGPWVSHLTICTHREIILLLSLIDSVSISTSCLATTKSSSGDQSEADILKSGGGSTSSPHLLSSMGLFRCRTCCRSSLCSRLFVLRHGLPQHVSPRPASINNKNKKCLSLSKCVAPLRHWLDQTGSGPELSPNHTLLICFAGKMFLVNGLPVPFVATAGLLYSTSVLEFVI